MARWGMGTRALVSSMRHGTYCVLAYGTGLLAASCCGRRPFLPYIQAHSDSHPHPPARPPVHKTRRPDACVGYAVDWQPPLEPLSLIRVLYRSEQWAQTWSNSLTVQLPYAALGPHLQARRGQRQLAIAGGLGGGPSRFKGRGQSLPPVVPQRVDLMVFGSKTCKEGLVGVWCGESRSLESPWTMLHGCAG